MISDPRRRRRCGQGIFGLDRRRRRRRAFRAVPSPLGAERDKNLDRVSRWAYDFLLSRPACIFIFSLASHRASRSERDRIAHVQRSFVAELGSGLREKARVGVRAFGGILARRPPSHISSRNGRLYPVRSCAGWRILAALRQQAPLRRSWHPGAAKAAWAGHQSVQGTVIKLPNTKGESAKDGQ